MASVGIAPDEVSLTVGETQALHAVLWDGEGNTLDRPVAWSSSDPTVASVEDGAVTGLSAGSAEVTATSEGMEGVAVVSVAPVPVASLAVSPASLQLTVGEAAQLSADVRDAAGNPLDRPVSWASADPSVATVDGSGNVTAEAVGSTSVTATSEGVSTSASVVVSEVPVASLEVSPASLALYVGAHAQLTAIARDASGNVLDRDGELEQLRPGYRVGGRRGSRQGGHRRRGDGDGYL